MKDLVDLLMPHFSDPRGREALIRSALFGCPVLHQIRWDGPDYTFTVLLVKTLLDYGACRPGHPAIVLVLAELKQQVGFDKYANIDEMIDRYSPQEKPLMEITSLAFLLEVGRWAMSELKERWTLRRKEQEIALDQLDEPTLATQTPEIVHALIAEKGKVNVDRTLERLQGKRDLIEGWKDALVADQKQHQLGDMSMAVLEAKQRHYHEKIIQTLREIEDDLKSLGFQVEKDSV